MRAVYAGAVLLGACGFEHGRLMPREQIDAPRAEVADAMVDATDMVTPDAPPDAPPVVMSWVSIESITVPVNGETRVSTTVLLNGVGYRLRASGTFVIQTGAGTQADAEWWDFNNTMDGVPGVDVGIAVNDRSST